MKNLLIAVLTTYILMGLDFWEFDGRGEMILISLAWVVVVFVCLEGLEETIINARRRRRWQEKQIERFKADIDEIVGEYEEDNENDCL